MNNPYLPTMTKITEKVAQNASVTLFKLEGHIDFRPGQFIMLTVPGCGEAPFSLTGDLEVCVRDTGHLTHRLHALTPGDTVGWRGPFGTSFDMAPLGPAVYIAGGIGIVPLRPVIFVPAGDHSAWRKDKGRACFPRACHKNPHRR
jgi:NAD(P)H-flavin reductase